VHFRGLLERLEDEAQRLQQQSAAVNDPQSLERALGAAHASLQDALSLGDKLLEAYRATLLRDGGQAEGRRSARCGLRSASTTRRRAR
jgi:hypothetical protein